MIDKMDLTEKELLVYQSEYEAGKKNKTTVILLWLFLGTLAGHRFYMGQTGYAIALVLIGPFTLFIWTFFDIFAAVKTCREMNEDVSDEILSGLITRRNGGGEAIGEHD